MREFVRYSQGTESKLASLPFRENFITHAHDLKVPSRYARASMT